MIRKNRLHFIPFFVILFMLICMIPCFADTPVAEFNIQAAKKKTSPYCTIVVKNIYDNADQIIDADGTEILIDLDDIPKKNQNPLDIYCIEIKTNYSIDLTVNIGGSSFKEETDSIFLEQGMHYYVYGEIDLYPGTYGAIDVNDDLGAHKDIESIGSRYELGTFTAKEGNEKIEKYTLLNPSSNISLNELLVAEQNVEMTYTVFVAVEWNGDPPENTEATQKWIMPVEVTVTATIDGV